MASQSRTNPAQSPMPTPVSRSLRRLGKDLSIARRTRHWTQAGLAQRMGVSLSTVRRMEEGYSGTALHIFLRALQVLGRLDQLSNILALQQDELGLELAQQQLPHRVRSKTSGTGRPTGAHAIAEDDDELEGF